MQSESLDIEVAYNQFYLMDAATEPEAPTEWSDEDVLKRLKVAPHVVALCPAKDFGSINVTIQVRDGAFEVSTINLDDWQHAVLGSIDLSSGQCAVEECEGALQHVVSVQPGTHRILFLCAGMDTLSEDGFDGDDSYRVVLWPAPLGPVQVLKQWQAAP